MKREHAIQAMLVVLLASAGCDALEERPGHDFSVRVLSAQPIMVYGQIYAPVRFAVDGCSEFDLYVEAPGSGTQHPVSFTERAGGTFEAPIPVALMRPTPHCLEAGGNYTEIEETLAVTCRDAGRTTRARFLFRAQPAAAWTTELHHARGLFPSETTWPAFIDVSDFGEGLFSSPFLDPQLVEGRGSFQPLPTNSFQLDAYWTSWPSREGVENPLVRPRLARRGGRGFVTIGCASPCASFWVAPGVVTMGEKLADVDLATIGLEARVPPYRHRPLGLALVPQAVVDMAYAPDGSLVVVSQIGELDRYTFAWSAGAPSPPGQLGFLVPWTRTLVTRVVPAPEGSEGTVEDAVTVIGDFPRETVQTRLARTMSGALAFATFSYPDPAGDVSVNLHVTDGSTVTTSYTAGGFGTIGSDHEVTGMGRVHLSPDASTMILSTGEGSEGSTWSMNVDPSDRVWHPFPADIIYHWSADAGAVWLPGAVALWSGGNSWDPTNASGTRDPGVNGVVQVFDDTPPHALRWEGEVLPLPGASVVPVLVGATAAGDKLVLTTTTGIRILGPDGRIVGGNDPFPCGLTTTAEAVQTGPTTVAVGADRFVYVFDVGEPSE